MDYEKKYKEAIDRAKKLYEQGTITESLSYVFPELKEPEDELKWLKQFIQEEAYSLSLDIRDNEDRIKLKNLQRALTWLGKQGQQKPAEWSEEDEMIALSIEQVMNCASLLNIVPEKIDKIRTWLKSLKDRYTWKPSKEQIRRLEYFLKLWGKTKDTENTKVFETVKSLYNDLKKLMEE